MRAHGDTAWDKMEDYSVVLVKGVILALSDINYPRFSIACNLYAVARHSYQCHKKMKKNPQWDRLGRLTAMGWIDENYLRHYEDYKLQFIERLTSPDVWMQQFGLKQVLKQIEAAAKGNVVAIAVQKEHLLRAPLPPSWRRYKRRRLNSTSTTTTTHDK